MAAQALSFPCVAPQDPSFGQGQPKRRELLLDQAERTKTYGSDFVCKVLESLYRVLDHAPLLAHRVDHWSGDFCADAVAMRLNSGLHALAKRDASTRLGVLFRQLDGDFDGAIGEAIARDEGFMLDWIAMPTQTNEVARSAGFYAALMLLGQRDAMPVDLLEIGASGGLNLNLARYRFQLAGQVYGDPSSALTIAPDWQGNPPVAGAVEIRSARGVDLHPLDLADPVCRDRMMAYFWADQSHRAARLADAMAIANRHPPVVERGEAGAWLQQELAKPGTPGVRRVVMHSMVYQYLDDSAKRAVISSLMMAGGRATPECPLAWLALEWRPDRSQVTLQMTNWPAAKNEGGETRILATCHPYGDAIQWRI